MPFILDFTVVLLDGKKTDTLVFTLIILLSLKFVKNELQQEPQVLLAPV